MQTADPARIRALVASQALKADRPSVLAIRAEPAWSGPDVINGTPPIRVVVARSPLAARDAVVRHAETVADSGEVLVLLTDCAGADLGLDLRARLLNGQVQSFDPFASLLALFRAKVLDPALGGERWLIDELIVLAPSTGWVDMAPINGVLTADLAWDTWQKARVRVEGPVTSISDLLDLADGTEVRRSLATLPDESRRRLAARWSPATPSAGRAIVDLMAGESTTSVTAVGLVIDLLWASTDDTPLAHRQIAGRARLEQLLGRDRLTPADASAWGRASIDRVVAMDSAAGVLAEAERMLVEVDAVELCVLSDVLPRGFDARLDALGRALGANDLDRASTLLAAIEAHSLAPRRSRRVTACRAAVRLLRRSLTPAKDGVGSSFAELSAWYRDELAWVEQVRRDLAPGDSSALLAESFGRLAHGAVGVLRDGAAAFAQSLVDWSKADPSPDSRVVPVEDLLELVVRPTARDAPVLLVVCDGMGLSVSHHLVADLRDEGWAPAAPEDGGRWPVGVATLPTVTSASRTSLLAGRLGVGAQAEERAGFSAHRGLRQASRADKPPVLFHKAGLVAANGAALPDAIRAAVADPDQRIVGVVVNSVDDHLARGDQINLGWDLASLGPLAWLLDAAAESGRVVILTADHGHVLDGGRSIARPQATEGGERWRTTATPAADEEVVVSGPRVLLGGGRVVLPVDERIRYGPPKHGYHGGATPEEVLVPVEVLARRLPPGWAYQPVVTPAWWDDTVAEPAAATGSLPPPPPPPAVRVNAKAASQSTLFDPSPAPRGSGTWVDALLASATFLDHRRAVRLPRPLPDTRLRGYLDALAANGGSIALPALAAMTGEPMGTVRMTLSVVQRLLNLDGADILAVRDDGSVDCNVELLAVQFDLDLPGLDAKPGAG